MIIFSFLIKKSAKFFARQCDRKHFKTGLHMDTGALCKFPIYIFNINFSTKKGKYNFLLLK